MSTPGLMTEGGYLSGLMPDILADFERKAREAKYFDNPTLWAKDKLGIDLWYKQTEIADALATGPLKSIAVRAGHGVGKSFLSAVLACWWIDTRPIQYVFVASTAPSADQVTAILWREIRGMWRLSHERYAEYLRLKGLGHDTGTLPDRPLPGIITQDNRWKDDLGNLIAQGRKPPDHNEDAFQGIHAQYVLAIGDEATGLNENMIDSLSNITSNAKSRRLLIANPTNPRSRLGEIFSNQPDEKGVIVGKAWSQHHISVLDSPNFHGGDWCAADCPNIQEHRKLPRGMGLTAQALDALTDRSYVEEKIIEYGEDSARFKARVLGEFAWDGGDVLFDDFVIGKARDATGFIDEGAKPRVVLGVDVARSKFGDSTFVYSATDAFMYELDDETGVPGRVTETRGRVLRRVDSFRGVPLVDRYGLDGTKMIGQATLIHQHAVELGAVEVRVDSGGLGVGLVDGLYALCKGRYRIVEMQGGGPTPDSRYWVNNRAFQLDQMRKAFEDGSVDVDPTDKLLIQQLEDILVEYVDPHQALRIESKVSMKKRGVKSPDAADAAWYTLADLSHLDGPKDGDVHRKTPDRLLLEREKQLVLNGFRDSSPF